MNAKNALKFIFEFGNDFQKAYTACLFGAKNRKETLELLRTYQNKDGGWYGLDPDYTGNVSSITCTMLGFSKFERLHISDCPEISQTVRYLKKEQKRNGSWDESPKLLHDSIPAWYYPRLLNNQLWFTNGTLRYLISRKPDETEMIEAARNFLRMYWKNGRFPGYVHMNWMGIVSFSNSAQEMDRDIYEGCMKNLESELDSYDFADVAWTLESYVFLKLPKKSPGVYKAIGILENGQQEDGGFGTSYGQIQRVDVTIEALDSMASYGEAPRNLDIEEVLYRSKRK